MDEGEWDEEVELHVVVRVTAKPNPALFVGWFDRKPYEAAITSLFTGTDQLERMDGFADLIGEAAIVSVEAVDY